jgi:hypothetical protein
MASRIKSAASAQFAPFPAGCLVKAALKLYRFDKR